MSATEAASRLAEMLQALQKLKPPGASKGKIADITTLCVQNVKSSSALVSTIADHFHSTPASHKLGVLFVVDSVTRQWIEKAKQHGQVLTDAQPPRGPYLGGVATMSLQVVAFVDDLVKNGPADQKPKVQSLVDIWRRGNTFPSKIAELENVCNGGQKIFVPSSTPPGSPPRAMLRSLGLLKEPALKRPGIPAPPALAPQSFVQPTIPSTNAASILAALASLGPSQQSYQPPAAQPVAQPAFPPNAFAPSMAGMTMPFIPAFQSGPTQSFPNFPPPMNAPPSTNAYAPSPAVAQMSATYAPPSTAQPNAFGPLSGLESLTSLIPPNIMNDPGKLTQVLTLFQELLTAGIPQDQWGPVVEQLYPPPAAQPFPQVESWRQPPASGPRHDSATNDKNTHRSEAQRSRKRSRSPGYGRNSEINRRGSPVYGTYGATTDANGTKVQKVQEDWDRGTGRSHRQRSPLGGRTVDRQDHGSKSGSTKWTDIDRSVPANHIKVLSRTLFVGGASCSDAELRAIFSRFGRVQTCIVNQSKRHAFVKMFTREDAVRAQAGMDNNQQPDVVSKARQTRWGVGFGPRECCDWSNGESIIPIERLTDADHKWALNAEYGGTGGRAIESGLVMEEPDIEIGAGMSSKAMSSRAKQETGPSKRGRHDKGRGGGGGGGAGGQYRRDRRFVSPHPESANVQPPPEVPNFGFQMPAMPPY